MTSVIRALTGNDWRDWQALRLEALQLHPEAFAASYEEESAFDETRVRTLLETNKVFAAYVDGMPVGTCAFVREQGSKRGHIGHLFGMYLKKDCRGLGIGEALVQAVTDHAMTLRRNGLMQIYCSAVVENPAAYKLYQKCGYSIYATEGRGLKVGDRYYDEYLLVHDLI